MGLLVRLLGGDLQAGTPGPADDFWYSSAPGQMTSAGIRIDEDGAKKISAWFRGREILATTLAMLPLGMNERLGEGLGRDSADDHPLHRLIHLKPNTYQDSFTWRRQAMYHLIDHGNSYHFIEPGSRGFVGALHPIHPKLVKPELLRSKRKVFHVRDQETGTTTTYAQDAIFHVCGMSDDGIEGKGILEYARESLGLNKVLDDFAARTFKQGGLFGGLIKVPGLLNPDASKRMAESFVTSQSSWHRPKVLEQGAEWIPNTMEPEKMQMLLSRQFGIDEMARFLGVPPHMLASLLRSTNNNIEHQGQEFITYSEGPWLSNWEFAINDQLVVQQDRYYAEFIRDALVRGDIAVRWEAYLKAVQTGVFTRNEVRILENKKALPGLDTPLDPANITGKQDGKSATSTHSKAEAPESDRVRAIVQESSARLLRKERAGAQKAAVKYAADADGFERWATEFYAAHGPLVAQTMQLDPLSAQLYCDSQRDALVTDGLSAAEGWTTDYLVGLALDAPRPNLTTQALLALASKPEARVTIEAGAMHVPVHVETAPVTVNQAPIQVDAPTTIAKGALQVDAPVTVHAPPEKKTTVKKTVKRDAKGQITSVTEEQT